MKHYTITWMNDDSNILATTELSTQTLTECIYEAFSASTREDGLGATQVTIQLRKDL